MAGVAITGDTRLSGIGADKPAGIPHLTHLPRHGYDKYKHTLADVLLPDGMNVNHTLVKVGWCWWYRKYAPGNTVLEGLEKDARERRKGLWADP